MYKDTPFKTIVFCDFDGTVTREDGFLNVCRHVAPELVKNLIPRLQEGEVTLRDAISEIIESVPSQRFPELLEVACRSSVRPGFEEFLKELKLRNIPLVVISGGLKDLVEAQLKPYREGIHDVFAAGVDLTGPRIRIVTPHGSRSELVDKTLVMKRFCYETAVAVGDGMTDFGMAGASHVVFARKHLADYMKMNKMQFHPWDDFHDILKKIQELGL